MKPIRLLLIAFALGCLLASISEGQVVYRSQPQIQQTVYVCPTCGRTRTRQATQTSRQVSSAGRAGDGYPLVYVAPGYESAYQQCLSDVQFYAQGNAYPGRYRGHPPWNLGGGLRAGTGYNYNQSTPNHCYYREGRTLVARARVIGRDGKVWWSSRYR